MKITGTFIDEISHDIPSANWNPEQWARDFDAMKNIGIDTVIIIRAGYQDKVTFDSAAIRKHRPILPVPFDLVRLFLDQAHRCDMDLYFGAYDSGQFWHAGDHRREIEINKAFTEEVAQKYSRHPAFKGWYICHEIHSYDDTAVKVYLELADHLKQLKPVPILISPYIRGQKQFPDRPITLAEHRKEWDQVFGRIKGHIDIVAFQDGHVPFSQLGEYIETNHQLAKKHGLISWSNVETFDRDMPIKFPPISWPKLLHKLTAAESAGVEKLITFEFSHFLSPNSIYPAAANLYRLYSEHIKQDSRYQL